MKQTILALTLTCVTTIAPSLPAQQPAPPSQVPPKPLIGSIAGHSGWPKARPEDVASVDAIISATYDVISGPKGQQRDWDRMRSLFLPDARLIPARISKDGIQADAVILSVDDYISRANPTMTASGFFEHSLHNEVQQFGNIVHVWSTYESRHAASDPQPFARGINSFQLLKDGERYWVVQIFWDSERPNSPIPPQYLPK